MAHFLWEFILSGYIGNECGVNGSEALVNARYGKRFFKNSFCLNFVEIMVLYLFVLL